MNNANKILQVPSGATASLQVQAELIAHGRLGFNRLLLRGGLLETG